MHAAPAPVFRWDIFCRVIDNFGDLGVCWRLARQLQSAGQQVRLWVDDAAALAWLAPDAAQLPAVVVLPWQHASDAEILRTLPVGDVWVEAFGCEIPHSFVAHGVAHYATVNAGGLAAGQRTRSLLPPQPQWINLEYLSAEEWMPRLHGLPSPVMHGPAKGWTKRFFYPGFTPGTGGLLREADLLQRQLAFDRQTWRTAHAGELQDGGRLISLFCYEPAALPQLLHQLTDTPDHLLVTAGRPLAAVQQALTGLQQAPLWSALPYTDQRGFDEILWACDLNFVRGEDSLVRALWAG
ncbi:MAG: elongation factor P maturation arginine rhamnosyltransferase EarP, partial [Rhodoferax sp.]